LRSATRKVIPKTVLVATLLLAIIVTLTPLTFNTGVASNASANAESLKSLKGVVLIGKAFFSADGIRGALVAGYDSKAGYIDLIVSGIDYSPEPNHFDVNVVRLRFLNTLGVKVLVKFNKEVGKGFAPPTNILPGTKLGLNWTAVSLADNRPYEKAPWKELRVYGAAWNGTKFLGPKELDRLSVGTPVMAASTYPWPAKGLVTVFYINVPYFSSYSDLMYRYGVLTYDLMKREVVGNATLPLVVKRVGRDFIINYTTINGTNVSVKTRRYAVTFCPANPQEMVGYAMLAYAANGNVYLLESKVDLKSGKAGGFKALNVAKDYDVFLLRLGTDRDYSRYYVAVDFISTGTWFHDVRLYAAGSNGFEKVFERTLTKRFYRAYIVFHDGLLLLLTQNGGVITINDLEGHEVSVLKLYGRFYAHLVSVPNPEWPDTYVLIIGVPSAETKAYFLILNPPTSVATTTTVTTSTATNTTTSSATSTTPPTTTVTTTTSSTTTSTTTTSTKTVTTTKTSTATSPSTTSATKTTRTSSTSSTTTHATAGTGTSTSTSTASTQARVPLSKGDWLEYHVKVHGEGPLGTMNFDTGVKVTVTSLSDEYIKLVVKTLKPLTYEQRSLITMGALTGNKLILALAAGKPSTVTYELPLQPASKACPILASPTGKEETITDSGTNLGHKYSVTCVYTPKGILNTLTFKDVYGSGNQKINVEITVTLTSSSKDVGATPSGGAGGGPLGGLLGNASLTTVLIISVVIAVAIIAVVLALTLRKK